MATTTTLITPQVLISKTPGKKRHYTFNMGAKGSASLQYESMWCKNAVGIINGQQWKFIRKGFWKNELEIIAEESPYTKTHIKFGWGHKMSVRAEDNNMYHLKSVGFWRRRWVWFSATGEKVMEIRSNSFSRKNRGDVTFLRPDGKELLWLMLVGWFQLVIFEEQAAAAAAS